MNAPTPEQMRELADQVDGYSWGDDPEVATALRAAADELDRLRGVIDNAPHDRDKSCGFGADPLDTSNCTCWKADAL